MIRSIVTILIVLGISCASAQTIELSPIHISISENGKNIYLNGTIFPDDDIRFRDIISKNQGARSVTISSGGGEVGAAIRIAEVINELQLDVIVERICASSCALYIAPAGRTLSIKEGGLISFHGGQRLSLERSLRCFGKATPPQDKLAPLEYALFEKIGRGHLTYLVSGKLTEPHSWMASEVSLAGKVVKTMSEVGNGDWIPSPTALRRLNVPVADAWWPGPDVAARLWEERTGARPAFVGDDLPPLDYEYLLTPNDACPPIAEPGNN